MRLTPTAAAFAADQRQLAGYTVANDGKQTCGVETTANQSNGDDSLTVQIFKQRFQAGQPIMVRCSLSPMNLRSGAIPGGQTVSASRRACASHATSRRSDRSSVRAFGKGCCPVASHCPQGQVTFLLRRRTLMAWDRARSNTARSATGRWCFCLHQAARVRAHSNASIVIARTRWSP
jgi:hypothetical protein